jgi:hypothetical protein
MEVKEFTSLRVTLSHGVNSSHSQMRAESRIATSAEIAEEIAGKGDF